ncbi:MAG TPA: glycosyltransferase family 2 protein [Anaerolineaceae bacterium]|jgi:glycosyltransferase involved in cell wall biosynthesis
MRQDVLAVIPAYNEADHIGEVVGRTRAHLPVLVVDDGSADATASLAEAAGAEALRQVPNQGKGAALRAGFRRALETGAAAVIMLDADGQHDPDEIAAFLAAFDNAHADLIIGERDYRRMPRLRRTTNTIGRWMLHWAMGRPIPDNQSGYRLISRRLLEALLTSSETGFQFEVEMIPTCILAGYTLAWVPIRTIYAGEKSHIQPLNHLVHFFRIVWQTRQRMQKKPLKSAQ